MRHDVGVGRSRTGDRRAGTVDHDVLNDDHHDNHHDDDHDDDDDRSGPDG